MRRLILSDHDAIRPPGSEGDRLTDMKQAVIDLPEDLREALEAYRGDQETPLDPSVLIEAALREYLAGRGYFAPFRPLRITPAPVGSGLHDISVEHDKYLAEDPIHG